MPKDTLMFNKSSEEFIPTLEDMMIATSGGNGIIPQMSRELFMNRDILLRPPIQRDEYSRLVKVSFLKDHIPTHNDIAIVIVEEDIEVAMEEEVSVVRKGIYLINGNTRRLWYEKNTTHSSKLKKTPMVATVYRVNSAEEYLNYYYSFDSSDSVENTTHKLQGAIGTFGLRVVTTVAKGGKFATALSIACNNEKITALEKVARFKTEIEMLDKCGIFSPVSSDLKSQALYGACLIAAKYWGQPNATRERLISGFQTISSSKDDELETTDAKWDGITALLWQMFHPARKNWIPPENQGQTNWASIEPQVDFFLYCMELYMEGTKRDKGNGFRRTSWKGKMNEILETLSTPQLWF